MKLLTDEDKKVIFTIDDSLFDHSRSSKTELLTKNFDHCSIEIQTRIPDADLRLVGWEFLCPVSHCLLSAAKDKNLLCEVSSHGGRSPVRKQSPRKAAVVMPELIQMAQNTGLSTKYVLFDSWFSTSKTISSLKQEHGLNTTAIGKNNKVNYSMGIRTAGSAPRRFTTEIVNVGDVLSTFFP